MKKILILMVMVLGLVACGEKFPYTSQSTKKNDNWNKTTII